LDVTDYLFVFDDALRYIYTGSQLGATIGERRKERRDGRRDELAFSFLPSLSLPSSIQR